MKSLFVVASFTLVLGSSPYEEDLLREEFLTCDYQSSQQMLNDAESAYCFEIYERLKKQVFNDDSAKFLAWWREAKKQKNSP